MTIIDIIINILFLGVPKIYNFIICMKEKKFYLNVQKIASMVEKVCHGQNSNEKLITFKEICNDKKVNVEKAIEYLEKFIIPCSNEINVFKFNKKDNNSEFSGRILP